ncbi:hypothetical protein ACFFRR_010108 [Megaselia abdita]
MYQKFIVFIVLCSWVNGSFCALVFPTESGSAAWGIFAALAVPLNLPHRNVFMSYNFEANYNLPWHAENLIPGILEKFEGWEDGLFQKVEDGRAYGGQNSSLEISSEEEVESTTRYEEEKETKSHSSKRSMRSLISRKNFYSVLHEKFKYAGYSGKPCVLKMICEVNSQNFAEHNGILGHLFHILFTPSSSKDEGLTDDYYKAESNGKELNCDPYDTICPHNVIDFISIPALDLFNNI